MVLDGMGSAGIAELASVRRVGSALMVAVALTLLSASMSPSIGPLSPDGAAAQEPAGTCTPSAAVCLPPDCDDDGDANADPNELQECVPPEPPPPKQVHDMTPSEKDAVGRDFVHNILKGSLGCGGAVVAGAVTVALSPTGAGAVVGVVVTGAFASACVYYWIEAIDDAVKAYYDPPDRNYPLVALPHPYPSVRSRVRPCPGEARRACRALRATISAAARAAGRAAAIDEAIFLTQNRLATAIRINHGAQSCPQDERVACTLFSVDRQLAAMRVLSGELGVALQAQARAEKAVATQFKRWHVQVRITPAAAKSARRNLLRFKGIPRAVMRRFSQEGYSRPFLRKALSRAFSLAPVSSRPVSLSAELVSPPLVADYATEARKVSVFDVAMLVGGVTIDLPAKQVPPGFGGVTKRVNIALNNDLQNAEAACAPDARTAAMRNFVTQVKSQVTGPARALLSDAAVPLLTFTPPTANVPPVAGFTIQSFLGSQTSLLFNSAQSTDPDGGHLGCRVWDFGDGRVATGAIREHAFRNPGTYVVTLTVVDDDGFVTANSQQTATIPFPQ